MRLKEARWWLWWKRWWVSWWWWWWWWLGHLTTPCGNCSWSGWEMRLREVSEAKREVVVDDKKWWQWCCWWLSHQAMWQLQLKGLEMRFSEVSEANSSKAPGVTQLISFPNKLKLFRLFRPFGRFSFSFGQKYVKQLEKYFDVPQTQHWQISWYLRYKYKYADAKCLPINYLKHGPVHSPDWILREKAETGTVELGTWEILKFRISNWAIRQICP